MSKPKRIVDPHQGQYQIVVSFRVESMSTPMGRWLGELRSGIVNWAERHTGGIALGSLDVAVRHIGGGGEASEDEGRWDRPSVLANTDDVEHVHPTTDVKPTGGKL